MTTAIRNLPVPAHRSARPVSSSRSAACTGCCPTRRRRRHGDRQAGRRGTRQGPPLGLYADVQADRAHHGGEEQAVYVYAQEDADHWAAELGYEVTPGFRRELPHARRRGERAVIGERWQVGTAVLEVTQPRTPCSTFARRLGEERWVKRFTDANRTGTYLRVVTPGEVRAGDTVEVVFRPSHGVTVADWFGSRVAGRRSSWRGGCSRQRPRGDPAVGRDAGADRAGRALPLSGAGPDLPRSR
ncbi:MOSC domain-containing protein [Oerskovia sp. M15]